MENGSLMEVEIIAECSPQTKVLMKNGSLMEVGIIAECSAWSILQYF